MDGDASGESPAAGDRDSRPGAAPSRDDEARPKKPAPSPGSDPGGSELDEFEDDLAGGARASVLGGALHWLRNGNRNPAVVDFIRRARRALPGDPEFGDPLSAAGVGGPRAAARAADRLLDRHAASREVSLAGLQMWQALAERVSGTPTHRERTLVFTDLVGFSEWSLHAGDPATLTLLRRVTQAAEPPMLAAGGHVVKRMGDGSMAVFADPATAVGAVLEALAAVSRVDVDGYTPSMRAGVHTGHPQRLGSDWLGVDVNIAARVMERATRGGLVISAGTLERISAEDFERLRITTRRVRRPLFGPRISGVPEDLAMYWVRTRPGDGEAPEAAGA